MSPAASRWGCSAGSSPGPLQILGSALLSSILKVNLPVALVATLYTNPLTIVPLYFARVQARRPGHWIQRRHTAPPRELELIFSNPGQWIPVLHDWITAMGKPFAIGLPLLAVILAVTGYLAVLGGWRLYVLAAWRRRAQARTGPAPG